MNLGAYSCEENITMASQMKVTVDGFRLVLIGDLHEQPMLQFNVKPFILTANDWSSAVSLSW